jgi:hypothetical protein
VSSKVKVLNPVSNGRGIIRRVDADHYVREGRAEWAGPDQLRLNLSHPRNVAAAALAQSWEFDYTPAFDTDRIAQALRLFGPNPPTDKHGRGGGGLSAADHGRVRFQRPPKRAPAFQHARRLAICDPLIAGQHQPDCHDAVRPNGLAAKWRTIGIHVPARQRFLEANSDAYNSGRCEAT